MSFILTNKVILLISPQKWGKVHLSKHHYAIELAQKGNTVYYLNPPDKSLNCRVRILACGEVANIKIVDYRPLFPFLLRFHARRLFDFLMGFQIRLLIRRLDVHFDAVWSFDMFLFRDISLFKGKIGIYHIADMLFYKYQQRMAESADLVLSVSDGLLNCQSGNKLICHNINHGLSYLFAKHARLRLKQIKEGNSPVPGDSLRIGYSGNILRKDLDFDVFQDIITGNKDVRFYFWGSTDLDGNNIIGQRSLLRIQHDFIQFLKAQENVVLKGERSPERLAAEIQEMDGFIICYNIDLDQSRGTNYHKIMEYLSTGKVIVSNNIITYKGDCELVQMPAERNNSKLAELFRSVIQHISEHNSDALMKKRIEFSLDYTYRRQVDKVEHFIEELCITPGNKERETVPASVDRLVELSQRSTE